MKNEQKSKKTKKIKKTAEVSKIADRGMIKEKIIQTAIVTGACGFIGSYMVDLLTENGFKVIATDLSSARQKKGFEKYGVEFIASDMTDKSSLKELFHAKIDYVFHFAAIFDYTAPWELLKSVNVDGTENLCELCVQHGIKRFVLISTGGVYGPPVYTPVNEEHPKNPGNDYERSKWMQEQVAMSFYRGRGMSLSIIRPGGVVYGPGNIYGAADIIKMLVIFKVAPVITNLKTHVAFVHARDIARAALFLSEREDTAGEVYNVGDGTAYTHGEFIDNLGKIIGVWRPKIKIPVNLLERSIKILYKVTSPIAKRIYPKKLLFDPESALYVTNDYNFTSDKIFKLGFKPEYPDVKEGIREFVDWYMREKKK